MTSPGRVVPFDSLEAVERELVERAAHARSFAYCPYSNFAVGAALRSRSGAVYGGCNIESNSFTPTICAERTAASKAVSEGDRDLVTVAVVANRPNHSSSSNVFTSPCGVCRQFLHEFGSDEMEVILAEPDMSSVMRLRLGDLLPLAYDARN